MPGDALNTRLCCAVLVLLAAMSAAAAPSPVGRWLTEGGRGVIEIAPCGPGLCGRIVGMAAFPADGSLPRDVAGKPKCGLEIVHALLPDGDSDWKGRITDPDTGSVYGATVALDETGRLRLRGYLGISLFGSTQLWTRYAGGVTADCRLLP